MLRHILFSLGLYGAHQQVTQQLFPAVGEVLALAAVRLEVERQRVRLIRVPARAAHVGAGIVV